MTSRAWLLAPAALLLALLHAPGLHAQAGQGVSSRVHPRRCSPAPVPQALPELATLIRVEDYRRGAQALWAQDGSPRGEVEVSLRRTAEGDAVRREVLATTLPRTLADSLALLAVAYSRVTPAARQDWTVRLRVRFRGSGDDPSLQVARAVRCEASPREWQYVAENSQFDVRERSAFGMQSVRATDADVAYFRLTLDSDGNVVDAVPVSVPLRYANDDRLLNYAKTMAFFPATVDGYPEPTVLVVPIRGDVAR